jgi:hypothetical protein
LVFVVLLWITRHPPGAVVPVYAAPATLRPAEAGVVIDGRVDRRDVLAGLADLALRGYLRIDRLDGWRGDLQLTVARPWLHDRAIRTFETVLLAHVFSNGLQTIRSSELDTDDYVRAAIREAISTDLAEHGLFAAAPLAVRRVGRGIALLVLGAWGQVVWGADPSLETLGRAMTEPWSSALVPGVATAAMLWSLAGVAGSGWLTKEGRHAREELRGFREYLQRVERPRLEQLPAGTLDAHLPWAIALGVTEAWLAQGGSASPRRL